MTKLTLTILMLCSASQQLAAQASDTTSTSTPTEAKRNIATCKSGEAVRTVEVVFDSPGAPVPCKVVYTKAETGAQDLWRAENKEGYCQERAAYLVEKLVGLGWTCD